jgi:tripartite-type tricarboxylate transporter receptor subunit TctC
MPKEIVKTLHDAFKKSLDDQAFLSVMDRYEMPVMYQNTPDFTKFWAEAYLEAGEHVRKFIPKQ